MGRACGTDVSITRVPRSLATSFVFFSRRLCDSVEASWRMARPDPVEMLAAVPTAKDAGATGRQTPEASLTPEAPQPVVTAEEAGIAGKRPSEASLPTTGPSPTATSRRSRASGGGGDRAKRTFSLERDVRTPRPTAQSAERCACSGHCYTTGHSKRKPACLCQEPLSRIVFVPTSACQREHRRCQLNLCFPVAFACLCGRPRIMRRSGTGFGGWRPLLLGVHLRVVLLHRSSKAIPPVRRSSGEHAEHCAVRHIERDVVSACAHARANVCHAGKQTLSRRCRRCVPHLMSSLRGELSVVRVLCVRVCVCVSASVCVSTLVCPHQLSSRRGSCRRPTSQSEQSGAWPVLEFSRTRRCRVVTVSTTSI